MKAGVPAGIKSLVFTGFLAILLHWLPLAYATSISESEVEQIVTSKQIDLAPLRSFGPEVMPVLIKIYERSNESTRANIAWVFYHLQIKSAEAKRVLMQDVHTRHPALRLQVQWALGRVSDDAVVVQTLIDNMRNDPNPLFRDKAACALASDQIYLNEKQKVLLYEGLIGSLDSPNSQVRDIAIKALKIQTGQTRGFRPNAPEQQRAFAISEWNRWLEEYKANL
jgi:hypothetical protein